MAKLLISQEDFWKSKFSDTDNQLMREYYESPILIDFLHDYDNRDKFSAAIATVGGGTVHSLFSNGGICVSDDGETVPFVNTFSISRAAQNGDIRYMEGLIHFNKDCVMGRHNIEFDGGEVKIKYGVEPDFLLFDALSLLKVDEDNWVKCINDELTNYLMMNRNNKSFYDNDNKYIGWWNKIHIIYTLLQKYKININSPNCNGSIDWGGNITPLGLIFMGDYLSLALRLGKKRELIELINLFLEYGLDLNAPINNSKLTLLIRFDFLYCDYFWGGYEPDYNEISSWALDKMEKKQHELMKYDSIYNDMNEIRDFLVSKGAKR